MELGSPLLQIRKLTIGDYDEMVEIWRRAGLHFRPQGRDSRDAIESQMKANQDFFIGAFDGTKLVGVVVASCDGRKGWLNRLSVDPNCRGRGIAKALISKAEEALRRRHVGVFSVLVEDSNGASKNLFRRCGYVELRDVVYYSKRDNEQI